MPISCDKSLDLKKYKGAIVYVKSDKIPYIQLDGGNLEVNTDDDTVTVKTSKELALFNQNDVLAIKLI